VVSLSTFEQNLRSAYFGEGYIREVMEEACDLFISKVRLVIFISEVHRLVISSYPRFVGL